MIANAAINNHDATLEEVNINFPASCMLTAPNIAKIAHESLPSRLVGILLFRNKPAMRPMKSAAMRARVLPPNTANAFARLPLV